MTFINNVLIVIVDSETKARDDLTAGLEYLENVQKVDHSGAAEPLASAPRDMATSFQFLHQAVSLKIRVSECPNLHQHGIFCSDL